MAGHPSRAALHPCAVSQSAREATGAATTIGVIWTTVAYSAAHGLEAPVDVDWRWQLMLLDGLDRELPPQSRGVLLGTHGRGLAQLLLTVARLVHELAVIVDGVLILPSRPPCHLLIIVVASGQ
jgi:hypothetical protein